MRQYKKVYRFMAGDPELNSFLNISMSEESGAYQLNRWIDREHVLIEPSALEFRFEECFIQAFGDEAVKSYIHNNSVGGREKTKGKEPSMSSMW